MNKKIKKYIDNILYKFYYIPKFWVKERISGVKQRIKNWRLGYGFISNAQIFDPISQIRQSAVKTLKLYKKAIIENRTYTLNTCVYEELYGKPYKFQILSEQDKKDLEQKWLEVLDDIIFFFEYGESSVDFYPDNLFKKDKIAFLKLKDDLDKRYERGGKYFIKYYQHLWD